MALRIPGQRLLAIYGMIILEASALWAQSTTDTGYQFRKLKEWRIAAVEHLPGKSDWAAVTIGGWPSYDLEPILKLISKIAQQPVSSAKRTLGQGRFRQAMELTDQEIRQADLSRVLQKALLLHTDIGLLELEKRDFQHKLGSIQGMGLFADGRVIIQPQNLHWQYARQLAELLCQNSSQQTLVLQWYVATTAHMLSCRLLGYAGQNLKSAHERFPDNPELLFYCGVLHETWAAPISQNPMLPKGAVVLYGSAESELGLARQYLQKAVDAKPDFAEAHLRLGRVAGLLGSHKQAISELQRAAASVQDPQLSYYAALFLAREFWITARRNEARQQYERAAALCPSAQSPLLALSRLSLDDDDVEGALARLNQIFALPHRDRWNDDPWWVYDLAPVRNATALVENMRKMFGGLR